MDKIKETFVVLLILKHCTKIILHIFSANFNHIHKLPKLKKVNLLTGLELVRPLQREEKNLNISDKKIQDINEDTVKQKIQQEKLPSLHIRMKIEVDEPPVNQGQEIEGVKDLENIKGEDDEDKTEGNVSDFDSQNDCIETIVEPEKKQASIDEDFCITAISSLDDQDFSSTEYYDTGESPDTLIESSDDIYVNENADLKNYLSGKKHDTYDISHQVTTDLLMLDLKLGVNDIRAWD